MAPAADNHDVIARFRFRGPPGRLPAAMAGNRLSGKSSGTTNSRTRAASPAISSAAICRLASRLRAPSRGSLCRRGGRARWPPAAVRGVRRSHRLPGFRPGRIPHWNIDRALRGQLAVGGVRIEDEVRGLGRIPAAGKSPGRELAAVGQNGVHRRRRGTRIRGVRRGRRDSGRRRRCR